MATDRETRRRRRLTIDDAMDDAMVIVDQIADENLRQLQTDLLVSPVLDLDVDEVDAVLAEALARWQFERVAIAARLRQALASA